MSARSSAEAARWAELGAAALRKLPTLADVRERNGGTQPVVEITLRRNLMAERGISVEAVANALAGGLGGVESSDYARPTAARRSRCALPGSRTRTSRPASTPTVKGVPVAQLVTAKKTGAPIEVVRVGQRPVAVVEGLIESGGTARGRRRRQDGDAVRLPSACVGSERRRPTKHHERAGPGRWLSRWRWSSWCWRVSSPRSRSRLVILTRSPCSGRRHPRLCITGQSLNAVALIGIVVMIGMADNEAVVKLDAIRRFREEGIPSRTRSCWAGTSACERSR